MNSTDTSGVEEGSRISGTAKFLARFVMSRNGFATSVARTGRAHPSGTRRHGDAGTRRVVEAPHMLKPGDVAPAFKVRDHLGNEHALAALRGKTVVLWFFPKADTPG